jgi:hypothetical protein
MTPPADCALAARDKSPDGGADHARHQCSVRLVTEAQTEQGKGKQPGAPAALDTGSRFVPIINLVNGSHAKSDTATGVADPQPGPKETTTSAGTGLAADLTAPGTPHNKQDTPATPSFATRMWSYAEGSAEIAGSAVKGAAGFVYDQVTEHPWRTAGMVAGGAALIAAAPLAGALGAGAAAVGAIEAATYGTLTVVAADGIVTGGEQIVQGALNSGDAARTLVDGNSTAQQRADARQAIEQQIGPGLATTTLSTVGGLASGARAASVFGKLAKGGATTSRTASSAEGALNDAGTPAPPTTPPQPEVHNGNALPPPPPQEVHTGTGGSSPPVPPAEVHGGTAAAARPEVHGAAQTSPLTGTEPGGTPSGLAQRAGSTESQPKSPTPAGQDASRPAQPVSTDGGGTAANRTSEVVNKPLPGHPDLSKMTDEEAERYLDELLAKPLTSLNSMNMPDQGLGAQLWRFNQQQVADAGSPELQASRAWLVANMPDALKQPGLATRFTGGAAQNIDEGQFAFGPRGTALSTDGVRTCVAGICVQGNQQLMFHAREMDHFAAIQEALKTAGIDPAQAETTLLPGPFASRTMENILPAFMRNGSLAGPLRVVPFKGNEAGGVVAHDGQLFLPRE